jgi:hypothetical protein
MTKNKLWYLEPFSWFSAVFLLLYVLLSSQVPVPQLPLINLNTQSLFPDSTKQFPPQEVSIHNSNLMTFLQEGLARQSSEISSRENTKTQTRLFYVTILAALVAVFAAKGANSNLAIVAVPMVLTILMYGLEINQDDLNRRGIDYYHIGIRATEKLVDLNPNDATWYFTDGRLVQAKEDSVSKTSAMRKLQKAFHPSFDQWILYVFPFWLMCLLILWRYSPLTRDRLKTLFL